VLTESLKVMSRRCGRHLCAPCAGTEPSV
jgi:hypothetical protein